MKVLFFEPFSNYSPHFETCLELMQIHLNKGDSVHFSGCNGVLPTCEPNWRHSSAGCKGCHRTMNRGLDLLDGQFHRFDLLTDVDARIDHTQLNELLSQNRSIEQVRAIHVDGFDIGMAAVSSFMHRTQKTKILSREDETLIDANITTSYYVYQAFKRLLQNETFDRVYIFNGRFAALRGVLRLCLQMGVECFTHERGATIHKYSLHKNCLPHEMTHIESAIRKCWDQLGEARGEREASAFYRGRRSGIDDTWYSFIGKQNRGKLPPSWDKTKKNIVIFNSSEHEFGAISDDWLIGIYSSQVEGIKKIARSVAEMGSPYALYLRMHPNLEKSPESVLQEFTDIRENNFEIIKPSSSVSTYALLDAASFVITFGSTVGIEAAYWGKPSILLSQSFYRSLGSVILPKSHNELIELLKKGCSALPRVGALMYGAYMRTFGVSYKYYEPEGFHGGKFKGVRLRLEPDLSRRQKLTNKLLYFFSKIKNKFARS